MCGRYRWQILAPIILVLIHDLAACADLPEIQVDVNQTGDAAVVREEEGRALILVSTRTGIGRLTMTAKNSKWPRQITLRLRYEDGKPLKSLEGFECTSPRLQIRSNSGQSGRVPFFLAGDDGKFSRDDQSPSGWLNLQIKPGGEGLDIQFPDNLWKGEKQVQIQWIDFYRI